MSSKAIHSLKVPLNHGLHWLLSTQPKNDPLCIHYQTSTAASTAQKDTGQEGFERLCCYIFLLCMSVKDMMFKVSPTVVTVFVFSFLYLNVGPPLLYDVCADSATVRLFSH